MGVDCKGKGGGEAGGAGEVHWYCSGRPVRDVRGAEGGGGGGAGCRGIPS